MKLQNILKEMPELRKGDRPNFLEMLCNEISPIDNVEQIDYGEFILYKQDKFIIYLKKIKDKLKVVSILEAPKTNQFKQYLQGNVIHEESIDTCPEFRGKGITSEFYYNLLKLNLSIVSDYKHYEGTKRLWKSLSKKDGVIIKVFKDHQILDEDYDLSKDELDVWGSNRFLILATTKKIIERLLNDPITGAVLEENYEGKSNTLRIINDYK